MIMLDKEYFKNWLNISNNYDGGIKGWEKDILNLSATDLCRSPRELRLIFAHKDEIEKPDFNKLFYSNIGNILHKNLEDFLIKDLEGSDKEYLIEKRKDFSFNYKDKNIKLTGKVDLIFDKSLYDLKTKSIYSKDKDNTYTIKGSIYKNILFKDNIQDNTLKIISLYRDWSKKDEATISPIEIDEYPLWTEKETWEYVYSWLDRFFDPDSECSDTERWLRESSFAVKKKEAKKASKVFKTQEEAFNYLTTLPKNSYILEERPSEPRKCLEYCSVSKFCSQFNTVEKPKNEPTKQFRNKL